MTAPEDVLQELAAAISQVEPSVAPTRIREVIGEFFPRHPPALRLLAAIQEEPGLLTSEHPSMPRALERIIAALIDEGATILRKPRCGGCGEQRPLAFKDGNSRICDTCQSRRKRTDAKCCVCSRLRRRHALVAGRDYCGTCWTTMASGAAALLAAAIQAALPLMDPELIVSAVAEYASGNPSHCLRLALECRDYGGDWFSNPAESTAQFLRLYDQLRRSGARLNPVACGHCGREARLDNILDGLRCCPRCYVHGRKRTCDGCGRVETITRRQANGSGLCQGCAKDLPDKRASCSVCSRQRPIAWNGPAGPVCSICRARQRIDICRTCNIQKPCLFSGTARAQCHECSKRKERCSLCGKDRIVGYRTSAGKALCKACGRAKEPCAGCGRTRTVVARLGGAAFCDYCNRRNPAFFRDCRRCGRHEKLRKDGHCDRCTADQKIADLFPLELLGSSPEARSMHAAFLASDGSTVIHAFRNHWSVNLLRALLSSRDTISHAALDAAGPDHVTRTVRAVLVQHGLLPPRDNHLARFEAWISSTAAHMTDPTERAAFVRFARWRHLRELRQRPAPISQTTATSRRRELQIILEFLVWARRNGRTLATLTQADIDHWKATGHGERHRVKAFLDWTHRNGLSARLRITHEQTPGPPSVTGPGPAERRGLLDDILSSDVPAAPATRLAAALILLFGVRPHQITALRLTDVICRGTKVHIRFGAEPLLLPDRLAALAAEACGERETARMMSTAQDTEWLMPGRQAGHPLTPTALIRRLRRLGLSPTPVRAGAMVSLAQELPPVILSRLTGLSTSNAIRWTQAVAASNARYASFLVDR